MFVCLSIAISYVNPIVGVPLLVISLTRRAKKRLLNYVMYCSSTHLPELPPRRAHGREQRVLDFNDFNNFYSFNKVE